MRSNFSFRASGLLIVAILVMISLGGLSASARAPFQETMEATMETTDSGCPSAFSVFEQVQAAMEAAGTAEPAEGTDEPAAADATEEADDAAEGTEEAAEGTAEAMTGPVCLIASLSGDQEVPDPGDPDGWGIAVVRVDPDANTVMFDVMVAGITLPAQAMHIHEGAEGVGGGVVVPADAAPKAGGEHEGEGVAQATTSDVDPELIGKILADPAGYYVNVHTSDFPKGSVRGNLITWEEGMAEMEGMMGEGETEGN